MKKLFFLLFAYFTFTQFQCDEIDDTPWDRDPTKIGVETGVECGPTLLVSVTLEDVRIASATDQISTRTFQDSCCFINLCHMDVHRHKNRK